MIRATSYIFDILEISSWFVMSYLLWTMADTFLALTQTSTTSKPKNIFK